MFKYCEDIRKLNYMTSVIPKGACKYRLKMAQT